jgi:hypothetical protein
MPWKLTGNKKKRKKQSIFTVYHISWWINGGTQNQSSSELHGSRMRELYRKIYGFWFICTELTRIERWNVLKHMSKKEFSPSSTLCSRHEGSSRNHLGKIYFLVYILHDLHTEFRWLNQARQHRCYTNWMVRRASNELVLTWMPVYWCDCCTMLKCPLVSSLCLQLH